MRLILLGAPGSGKGTIAEDLTKIYGVLHISTGDIFRANIKEQTPLGIDAKQFIDKGELVPDSITIAMIRDRLSQADCQSGFMLDGFPRTIFQAQELDRILEEMGEKLDAVVNTYVSDEIIKTRVSNRRICSSCGASFSVTFRPTKEEGVCDLCGGSVIQRDDDKPETVLSRLKTYYEKTQPLTDFYEKKGLIIPVNNEVGQDQAIAQITSDFEARNIR
jgi:adenylate kinase